ncbi:MAG: aminodeoxychorismate/anthranilate synthase component II [Myxococcota bacterium]
MIDNYDSFTYNLVQAFRGLGATVDVVRNDAIDANEAVARDASHLVVSPGPGRPEDAGHSLAILEAMVGRVPILGVCLGHQCLATLFGGRVGPAATLMHGKTSALRHDGTGLFTGLPEQMEVGRYHSLAVTELPEALRVTAHTDDGEVMAVVHREQPVHGVQFHPESVLTPQGVPLLANFLEAA